MSPTAPAPRAFSPIVYGASRCLLAVWARLWLRLSIEGRQHVPATGPLLAVGNHCSYLDPPLLGVAVTRPVQFLAQQGLARFAPLGWWLGKAGVSLIDRQAPSKDVLRWLANALEQGACVSVFPEGTRSDDGRIGPFRNGVEFLVRRTGAPVLPVGIDGSFRAYPRGARWPRPSKCSVRIGPVWAADRVLAAGGTEALRREIAVLSRQALRPAEPAPAGDGRRVDHGRDPVPADPRSPSTSTPNTAS